MQSASPSAATWLQLEEDALDRLSEQWRITLSTDLLPKKDDGQGTSWEREVLLSPDLLIGQLLCKVLSTRREWQGKRARLGCVQDGTLRDLFENATVRVGLSNGDRVHLRFLMD